MLSLVSAALAFNAVAPLRAPTSTRAPVVVSMNGLLESNFVYAPNVPLSKGLPGFSNPTSFAAETVGKVMPTAEPAAVKGKAVSSMAGGFVYGSPVPLSKGVPGFSNLKHVNIE